MPQSKNFWLVVLGVAIVAGTIAAMIGCILSIVYIFIAFFDDRITGLQAALYILIVSTIFNIVIKHINRIIDINKTNY